jgi:hypothetical protein
MKRLGALADKRPDMKVLVVAQHEQYLFKDQATMTEQVLQTAREQGFEVLDFFPLLARLKQEDEARFRSFFTNHMTAAGNAFIAERVYAHLKEARIVNQNQHRPGFRGHPIIFLLTLNF